MLTLQHKTSWILLAAGVVAALGFTAQYIAHGETHAKVIQLYILPMAFEANPIPMRHVLLFPGQVSGAAFLISVIAIAYGFLASVLGGRPRWRLRAAFGIALASFLFVLMALIIALRPVEELKTTNEQVAPSDGNKASN